MSPPTLSVDAVLDALDRHRAADGRFGEGVDDLSMDALAAAAGVSRATLYRLFGSQRNLLEQLGIEPTPSVRGRVLETALDLVGSRGAAELSMDELATAAGVSRATLYRLFPGKAMLLAELVRRHSPFDSIADVLETMRDQPPAEVIPALAGTLAAALNGRMGLLLELLAEVTRGDSGSRTGAASDADLEAAQAMRTIPLLASYLEEQMAAGRLRRMDPFVAFQALTGPIVMHLLSQPLGATRAGRNDQADLELPEVVDEFVGIWLAGMSPTGES